MSVITTRERSAENVAAARALHDRLVALGIRKPAPVFVRAVDPPPPPKPEPKRPAPRYRILYDTPIGPRELARMTATEIMRRVCHRYGVTIESLKSQRRMRSLVAPRHEAMWLCCVLTDYSLPHIASVFRRDHTTVLHGRDMFTLLYALPDAHTAEARRIALRLLDRDEMEIRL